VNWLADNSVEFIQSQLNVLGENWTCAKIWKNVAVSIQDDHNWQVLDNLDGLLSLLGIKSCSAHLMLQYALTKLTLSLVTIGLTVSLITGSSLDLFFYQSIAVDTNVLILAHVFDWIPPNMKDIEEIQKMWE